MMFLCSMAPNLLKFFHLLLASPTLLSTMSSPRPNVEGGLVGITVRVGDMFILILPTDAGGLDLLADYGRFLAIIGDYLTTVGFLSPD